MGAGAGLNSNTQNKQLEKDKRNNVSGYDDAVKCGKKVAKMEEFATCNKS